MFGGCGHGAGKWGGRKRLICPRLFRFKFLRGRGPDGDDRGTRMIWLCPITFGLGPLTKL